ncbi:NUDIX hydrolase [Streptomyces sp. NBC_01237]|uniref:NUDIX hydrolase n=1 Tax=Streptomyces sp. NBC_01237 TaxID=2903790 RepID=UPI0030910673|nr:NUDIX hydrolase [Streptomyces sp. NBC_01237]
MSGATSHPDADGGHAADGAGPVPDGDRDRGGAADGAGPAPDPAPVLAAGCVLWRRSPYDGGPEICLVHRPKYDDWSFPKGKLKRGEAALDGALREVLEETGHHCTPGTRLPTSRYVVNGRPKEVAYWAAEATSGAFAPNDEVDRLAWLSPTAARNRLTRPRDRDQLEAALPDLLPHA